MHPLCVSTLPCVLDEGPRETQMIHRECDHCGVGATMVQTDTGDIAWADHMATHSDGATYRTYTWTVVQLWSAQGDASRTSV